MSSIASKSGSFMKNFAARLHIPAAAALVATALIAGAPTVFAQEGGQLGAAASEGLRRNLDNFIHYVLVGKADLAQAAGEAVLSASATDVELAVVVDEAGLGERLAKAVARSRVMGGVADLATRIDDRVEDGRLSLSRDPQRIANAVAMLSKTLREQHLGAERIEAAGEYAVPQLLAILVEGTDSKAEVLATRSLVSLKRYAVLPLASSLHRLPSEAQRKVVGILADLGWPTALPFICEVADAPGVPADVKAACEVAVERLGGKTSDVAAQFTALARKFFDREDSLLPHKDEPTNNVWSYEEAAAGFGTLVARPVATEAYFEQMAMDMARRALSKDAANNEALAIYIAADLRMENKLGSDARTGRYSPQFYATAAGPSICSMVLSMAIDTRDTALVRDAIKALSETAGGAALTASAGRTPMLEALRYSDRRVALDAALALAASEPMNSFPADFMVVPTIASALGDAGATRAAILGGSVDDRRSIGELLSSGGFQTVAGAETFDGLEVDVVKAKGVDLVIVRGSIETVTQGVARVRAFGTTAAAPVLVIANALEETGVRRAFEGNASVKVWTEGSTAESFQNAVASVMRDVVGPPMDEAEADEYAIKATEALRSIASRGVGPLRADVAEGTLLKALASTRGGLRVGVANVLSVMATPAAVKALVDAALAAESDEQVEYLDLAASAARKSGTKGDESQLSALRELVAASEGAVADAAGRLYGSLDAGSSEAVKLIISE